MKMSIQKFLFVPAILACLIPTALVAQDENPVSDPDFLILTVPIIATARHWKEYRECVDELMEGCQSTYDYCMKTPDEKLSHQLQLCYDQKIACFSACESQYMKCCNGYSECPQNCITDKSACMEICEANGTQCTLNAINGNYDFPDEDECLKDFDDCAEYTAQYCDRAP